MGLCLSPECAFDCRWGVDTHLPRSGSLAQAPLIGRERTEFSGRPRSFTVRPYVIFYEPLAEGDGILVWRVIHGARNLQRLIIPPDP